MGSDFPSAELTPTDRALFTRRRKEIYEALHPETRHGGDRKSSGQVGHSTDAERFTADTAAKTGRSERDIRRDVTRGERVTDAALVPADDPRPILALFLLFSPPALADACRWREPPRTYPAGLAWNCAAIRWADGDTLTARCAGQAAPIRVRLRGVDTVERGHPRWRAARLQLRRRTEAAPLVILPHHGSHNRVVATVLADGRDVGRAMDGAGWSKAHCPRR